MEYSNIFKDENGTEIEIKAKTECSTQEEVQKALSFMAQSSRRFYLDWGEKISNTL